MKEILNFFKEIFMLDSNEKMPIGLCGFECAAEPVVKTPKPRKKREMRLSELMDK